MRVEVTGLADRAALQFGAVPFKLQGSSGPGGKSVGKSDPKW